MEMIIIYIIFCLFLLMNCLTEYQFNKIMFTMKIFEKKNFIFHATFSLLRIIWIYLCAFFNVLTPVLLIGLFILLFTNIVPYKNRRLIMNNFIMIIYLLYISIFMMVIGCAGLMGFDLNHMLQNMLIRIIILSTTFMFFNLICFFALNFQPQFLIKEDYDRFKVVIYTRFLFICVIYQIFDSMLLTLCQPKRINYFMLVSGDIVILILIINFLNYNYIFAKNEEMKREYEENQVLMAQQYFEKERLKKLSELDALTNTYNRREISSIMSESIQNGHKLACAFIDLDGLKRTNDNYGHTFGDMMLKRFADEAFVSLQGKGYLARIGGDEFLLIFIDQEIDKVEECINELQQKLLEPEAERDKIYFSYGISYDEETVDTYITIADQKMYECKNRKRCDKI